MYFWATTIQIFCQSPKFNLWLFNIVVLSWFDSIVGLFFSTLKLHDEKKSLLFFFIFYWMYLMPCHSHSDIILDPSSIIILCNRQQ